MTKPLVRCPACESGFDLSGHVLAAGAASVIERRCGRGLDTARRIRGHDPAALADALADGLDVGFEAST